MGIHVIFLTSFLVVDSSMSVVERGLTGEGPVLKSVLLSLDTFYERIFEWLVDEVTQDTSPFLTDKSNWILSTFQRLDAIRTRCTIDLLFSSSISTSLRNHVIHFVYSLVLLYSKPTHLARSSTLMTKLKCEEDSEPSLLLFSFSTIAETCLDRLLLACRSDTLYVPMRLYHVIHPSILLTYLLMFP